MKNAGKVAIVIGIVMMALGCPTFFRDPGATPPGNFLGLLLVIVGGLMIGSSSGKRIVVFTIAFPVAFFGDLLLWVALYKDFKGGYPALIIGAVIFSAITAFLLVPDPDGKPISYRVGAIVAAQVGMILLGLCIHLVGEANENSEMPEALLGASQDANLGEMETLLSKKPDLVLYKNAEGQTALHRASLAFRQESATLLLQKGAMVNAKDNVGKTPMHYAACPDPNYNNPIWPNSQVDFESGSRPLVKVLLANGADINARDNAGKTPLDYAIACGRYEYSHKIQSLLISAGAKE